MKHEFNTNLMNYIILRAICNISFYDHNLISKNQE